MKITRIKHSATKQVLVEFEEFFEEYDRQRIDEVINYMNSTDANRMAYNIWKFKTEEAARNSLFVMGLKL
jgi:hypothetical protein